MMDGLVVVAREGYGGMEQSVINLVLECLLVCAMS
jgi:hypothetical protein